MAVCDMDMSERITEMMSDLDWVADAIPYWVRDECADAADEIAQLNRDRLMEGKAPDGSDISPFYAPLTIAYKRRRGGITDRVTLYDYGNFHASLHIFLGNEEFWVESDDGNAGKVHFLLEHYLGQVLGFSEADVEYISAFIVAEPVSKKLYDFVKG